MNKKNYDYNKCNPYKNSYYFFLCLNLKKKNKNIRIELIDLMAHFCDICKYLEIHKQMENVENTAL